MTIMFDNQKSTEDLMAITQQRKQLGWPLQTPTKNPANKSITLHPEPFKSLEATGKSVQYHSWSSDFLRQVVFRSPLVISVHHR